MKIFVDFGLPELFSSHKLQSKGYLEVSGTKELKSSQSEDSFLHWDEVVVLEGLFFHLELSVLFSDLLFL
jgi:hypothetical protein